MKKYISLSPQCTRSLLTFPETTLTISNGFFHGTVCTLDIQTSISFLKKYPQIVAYYTDCLWPCFFHLIVCCLGEHPILEQEMPHTSKWLHDVPLYVCHHVFNPLRLTRPQDAPVPLRLASPPITAATGAPGPRESPKRLVTSSCSERASELSQAARSSRKKKETLQRISHK